MKCANRAPANWYLFVMDMYGDGENGQNVFFFSSAVTKQFDFFNFSTVLKRFCPLDSKNVFVLVLAHLEPELELFVVDDIGDDGDDDLKHHYLPNSSGSGSR